jgi:two-component system, OmpR family, aerobic respiration control sensor histidine kinase ArcB
MIHSIDCAQLIDALKVNIVWKDLRSHYIGANQHFLEVVGLSAETLSGKTDYDLTTHDLAKKIIENDQEVFAKRETLSFHEHIIDSEGNTKIYLSYKTPLFDQDNELFGLTTLAIDVTEVNKKESLLISESHAKSSYIDNMGYFDQIATMFNQMASNIPANIFWKDVRGIYLGCNDANTRMVNSQGADTIIGKNLYDLFPKEIADKVNLVDNKVLSEGVSVILEEEGLNERGERATYITNKAPVRNDKGEVIGLLGISVDISEQKKLEKDLREAKEKAEEADRAKASFIMNISHDIRTPFMGILGFSEMLETQEQDPFKKETLGYIRQSAQRLLSWMNEIIEVVSSSGEEGNNDNPIYIDQLMEDLTELMRARIELKKLQWIVIVDPKIPKHLVGDLGGLRRILLNLVGNSVKFTDEGSVTIESKLVSREGDEVILDILVRDTGIGIPSEKFSEIFKKFSRLTSSYSGKYPGSGLGLYNISQIIERMGGTVSVESTVGKGSVFTCRLPLQCPVEITA